MTNNDFQDRCREKKCFSAPPVPSLRVGLNPIECMHRQQFFQRLGGSMHEEK